MKPNKISLEKVGNKTKATVCSDYSTVIYLCGELKHIESSENKIVSVEVKMTNPVIISITVDRIYFKDRFPNG